MIILLLTISILTYWSLRLMRRAFEQREFSLMFAGTLVALAAAGLVAAYSLMIGCVGYLGNSYTSLPVSMTSYTEDAWVFTSTGQVYTIPQELSIAPTEGSIVQ